MVRSLDARRASAGRQRRLSLSWQSGQSRRTAMTSAPLPRWSPSPGHHFFHGVTAAMMVLVPRAHLWATAVVSRRGEKNPIVFALPGYREGIRPHRS